MNKQGSPNGTVKAELYAHTGTFGTSGVPTGAVLATSTTVIDNTTLPTSAAWTQFEFDGTVTLTNATKYVIVVTTTNTLDSLNAAVISGDTSSPTHAGNSVLFNGTVWSASSIQDNIFQVFTDTAAAPTTAVTYDSPNLTNGQATTNRLTGGTGTFVAGKVSEDGLMDDLGWAGNNYTELVYAAEDQGSRRRQRGRRCGSGCSATVPPPP